MNKPHKHAALIKAWADGAEIEVYSSPRNAWSKIYRPLWDEELIYRIKPTPIKKKCWVLEYKLRVTGGTSILLASNHQYMVDMQKDPSFIRIIAEIEYEETPSHDC